MKKLIFCLVSFAIISSAKADVHVIRQLGNEPSITITQNNNIGEMIGGKGYAKVWQDEWNCYIYCKDPGSLCCCVCTIFPSDNENPDVKLAKLAESLISKGQLTGKIIQDGYICVWKSDDALQSNSEIHVTKL